MVSLLLIQIYTSNSDINKIMSSFLNDFKSLINPMISLLTKVISNLLEMIND